MKFKLSRASDFNENPVEVDVETIEDLKRIVEIMREYGNVSNAINEWLEV